MHQQPRECFSVLHCCWQHWKQHCCHLPKWEPAVGCAQALSASSSHSLTPSSQVENLSVSTLRNLPSCSPGAVAFFGGCSADLLLFLPQKPAATMMFLRVPQGARIGSLSFGLVDVWVPLGSHWGGAVVAAGAKHKIGGLRHSGKSEASFCRCTTPWHLLQIAMKHISASRWAAAQFGGCATPFAVSSVAPVLALCCPKERTTKCWWQHRVANSATTTQEHSSDYFLDSFCLFIIEEL